MPYLLSIIYAIMQTAYRSTNYLHTYVHKEVRQLFDLEKLFLICDKLLQSYKGG